MATITISLVYGSTKRLNRLVVITVTSASPKGRYKMAQIKSAKAAGHDGYTGVTFQNGSEQKLSMQAKMQ